MKNKSTSWPVNPPDTLQMACSGLACATVPERVSCSCRQAVTQAYAALTRSQKRLLGFLAFQETPNSNTSWHFGFLAIAVG